MVTETVEAALRLPREDSRPRYKHPHKDKLLLRDKHPHKHLHKDKHPHREIPPKVILWAERITDRTIFRSDFINL